MSDEVMTAAKQEKPMVTSGRGPENERKYKHENYI